MMNKHVAQKFKLVPSNLHKIIMGRKYARGHEVARTSRAEEHGEKYVMVAKIATATKSNLEVPSQEQR